MSVSKSITRYIPERTEETTNRQEVYGNRERCTNKENLQIMRLQIVTRLLTIWLTKRMIHMDVHMGPQGGLDLLFIPASEFVYLSDSLAKLEPICVVQVVLKHTQSKWVMWSNSGNDTTVSTIILA